MSVIELGVQSFKDLGKEFIFTVLGLGATGKTSVICGATDEENLTTYFYLNPFGDEECAGSDLVLLLMLVAIIHTISWWSRWLLWEPLANLRMKGHPTWTRSECEKFSQTCTSAMFFSLSAIFVARILLSKDWLFVREEWPNRIPIVEADYKFYYLLYASRFISDLVSIFFEDRKKEAFVAAVIHHLATLGLVLGSAHVGHMRFGGVIMFFFDWADIPLLFAKLFKYLSKDPKDNFQFAANRLFEVFAVLFFLTRNVCYTYVAYCALMDLASDFVSWYCQVLLVTLVGLQTYWFVLVIKAVIRQKQNDGVIEDVREEDKKKVN